MKRRYSWAAGRPALSRSRRKPDAGFTLIELLTVLAVIAILAAILIPVVADARRAAGKATAVVAMREIGTGVLLFAAENDEYLPNGRDGMGFWLSHHALNIGPDGDLPAFLARYLEMPIAKDPNRAAPIEAFVSRNHLRLYPGLRASDGGVIRIYASNRSTQIGTLPAPVFGFYATPGQGPLSLSLLDGIGEPVWLIQEADQQGGYSADWDRFLFPIEPVHGNVRHRLYLDGHVRSLSLEESLLQ